MCLSLIAAIITFQGATVSENPRYLSPVEIRLSVTGQWENPYDPNDVSVSARVVGTKDVATDVPGFWMVPYQLVEGEARPAAEGEWRIRFAPWNTGPYSVFVRGFDRQGPGEMGKMSFRVEGYEKGKEPPAFGYVIPAEKLPYFEVERKPFVPVGCYLTEAPTKADAIAALLHRAAEAGADFVSIPLYVPGWKLEQRLQQYDQEAAWRLDYLLETAQRIGLRVFLRLEGGDAWTPSGWSQNPYAKDRGGPCATRDEFWSALRPRQMYKKFLQYLIARNAWRSSLLGIQFFDDVAPPAYWLDEMSQVVYDLHPYLVVQAAIRTEEESLDSKRLNTWALPQGALLSTWRNRTKKPILVIPSRSEDPIAQAWRQLFGGASAALAYGIPPKGSLAPLRALVGELPWGGPVDTRKLDTDGFGSALLFDSVVAAYVESPKAGEVLTLPVRRDGTYEGSWRDSRTGQTLPGSVRGAWKREARVVTPNAAGPIVFVAKRVGG